MDPISIGKKRIGTGEPCFIVAEIGINHNGDLALAHSLIDEAAKAGADAVKIQNYKTEDFVIDSSLMYEFVSQGNIVRVSQYDMFKKYELNPDVLPELCDHCIKCGIEFLGTPTSEEGVEQLIEAGATLIKNGSDFLTHIPLIRVMARTRLPTILSTGMATLAEIDEAVHAFRESGGSDLIVLHCVSSYPTPSEDVHLRKIPVLSAAFGCHVGFSDHTEGTIASLGSVVHGACMIEKHFTLDKDLPGPDHRFSMEPEDLHDLVQGVRIMERCLGESTIGPTQSEIIGRESFRLSCVAARDLDDGHLLTQDDVVFQRPGGGLPPRDLSALEGRRLACSVTRGTPLTWVHII